MLPLPPEAHLLLDRFASAFTRPTFERFQLLCVGSIVCFGRRTVSRILWTVRVFLDGHPSSYHRFFSHARWSSWPLGKVLAAAVLELVPEDQPVLLALDDTTDGPHHGKRVYGASCWRDAVRSSWKRLTHKWGQKWVVLAVLVPFPFSGRRWALPVLVALARKRELDEQEGRRRHKDAGGPGPRAAGGPAALVPRTPVHLPGRLGLRQPRAGVLRAPSPAASDARRPLPVRHLPLRHAQAPPASTATAQTFVGPPPTQTPAVHLPHGPQAPHAPTDVGKGQVLASGVALVR